MCFRLQSWLLICVPGVYRLASDHSTSVSVVCNWPDVISSMLQFVTEQAPVHIPVLCWLSASVETVSWVSHRDSSSYENTEVCAGYWRSCRRLPLLAVRTDTSTFASVFCSGCCSLDTTSSVAARFGRHGMPPPASWPFHLETGVRVASKVGNLPSKLGHARPLGSRIIRYVHDGQTDRQKATLIAPFTTVGGITVLITMWCVVCRQSTCCGHSSIHPSHSSTVSKWLNTMGVAAMGYMSSTCFGWGGVQGGTLTRTLLVVFAILLISFTALLPAKHFSVTINLPSR